MSNVQAEGVIPASIHTLNPWASIGDLPEGRIKRIGDINFDWMLACATDLLYSLSGRKWRSGRSIVRPTARVGANQGWWYNYPWSSMSGYGSGWGYGLGWAWSSIGLGFWQGGGVDQNSVFLQYPVTAVEELLLNGMALTPSEYTLYDRKRLVLNVAAGNGNVSAFPWEQQLTMPVSQPGTCQITYRYGSAPPESGRLACAELAIELALAFTGSNDCRLPQRVLTVATEGVSVAVGDAMTYVLQQLSGLPICDMFLRSKNPQRAQRRSAFAGPNTYVNHTQ